MSVTLTALLTYVAWVMVLLFAIASLRTFATFFGGKKANSFDPAGDDVSPLSGRLCRAHANCYESFPFIGGLLLAALATDQTAITDGLAMIVVYARVAQSSVHMISKSVPAVFVRFGLFLVQVGICLYWLASFFSLV